MSAGQLAHPALVEATGRYLHWGVVQLSLTNFLIIVGMAVVFVLALVVPFPGGHGPDEERSDEQ